MQLSEFEKRVLAALIGGEPEHAVLEAQMRTATVADRDYTGVGLYTKLVIDESCPRLTEAGRYIEETPQTHLTHPSLSVGAGAMLWLSDGRIDTLECYTYEGEWPTDEAQFTVLV